MDMGYVVNNTCLYGSIRKRGFSSSRVLSGVNSMEKLQQKEGKLQFSFMYFR
jgi:hypothetical protein